jgi:cell wall-associated NlpC family hydrolase
MQNKLTVSVRFFSRILILVVVFVIAFSSIALASPSPSSLKAKKQQIIRELDALDAELDEAVEAYNQANWELQKIKKKSAKISSEINKTQKEIDELESRIRSRARALYMMKQDPVIEALMNADSLTEIISSIRMIGRILSVEADLNSQYKEKKQKLERDRAELAQLLERQKKLVKIAKQKKLAIQKKIREKERLLASIDSELKKAIERERAASRRVSYSYVPPSQDRSRSYVYRGDVDREEPSSDTSIGRRAVSIALSLLGRPYRWGASGPNSFDCSGFTMYVYAQLGISLPHSSAAQYYSGRRVSYEDLAPGDLVFFARRSGRISHVGLYIGGGMMVHAPQTGDVVKVVPLSSHSGYVGAVRPY